MTNQTTVLNQMVDFVRELSAMISRGHIAFSNAADAYWMANETDRILIETRASSGDFVHDAACILAGFDDLLTPEKFRRAADYEKFKIGMDAIANRYADLVDKQQTARIAA